MIDVPRGMSSFVVVIIIFVFFFNTYPFLLADGQVTILQTHGRLFPVLFGFADVYGSVNRKPTNLGREKLRNHHAT